MWHVLSKRLRWSFPLLTCQNPHTHRHRSAIRHGACASSFAACDVKTYFWLRVGRSRSVFQTTSCCSSQATRSHLVLLATETSCCTKWTTVRWFDRNKWMEEEKRSNKLVTNSSSIEFQLWRLKINFFPQTLGTIPAPERPEDSSRVLSVIFVIP